MSTMPTTIADAVAVAGSSGSGAAAPAAGGPTSMIDVSMIFIALILIVNRLYRIGETRKWKRQNAVNPMQKDNNISEITKLSDEFVCVAVC